MVSPRVSGLNSGGRRGPVSCQEIESSAKFMELARGIEPPTCGLQNRCSAIELRQPGEVLCNGIAQFPRKPNNCAKDCQAKSTGNIEIQWSPVCLTEARSASQQPVRAGEDRSDLLPVW